MLIEADDVNDAVARAQAFQREGRYQWFRGQTRNWTLLSSLNRRGDDVQPEIDRFKHFRRWLHSTPGLEHLAGDLDAAVAVAQHYGLGTHFIDFTTDPAVAGFFATEGIAPRAPAALVLEDEEYRFFGGQPPRPDIGVILCLDRDKLMDAWELVASHMPADAAPEFLERSIPDLWRLQAQRGVFLYCPARRFEEVVYDLDRIVFPHTGQVAHPPAERIYPARKSHLEALLDQYFQLRLIAENPLDEMLPPKVMPNRLVLDTSSVDDDHRYLARGPVPPHRSWRQIEAAAHVAAPGENFDAALTDARVVLTWRAGTGAGVSSSVRRQVLAALRDSRLDRGRLMHWAVRAPDAAMQPAFEAAATAVFDAMRRLPVTAGELATAIGECLGLMQAAGSGGVVATEVRRRVFAAHHGSPGIDVELVADNNAYSRAMVSLAGLQRALRSDLDQHLNEAGRTYYAEHPEFLLTDIGEPRRLFTLRAFRRLFYGQIVPAQAAFRPDLPLLAALPRVQRIGLP
jgi:hypothetical protein